MSNYLSTEIIALTRDLVQHITGLKETADAFKRVEKLSLKHLQGSDSLYFLNRKEIDSVIASLSDKFLLHSYCNEAQRLQRVYELYMDSKCTKGDVSTGLNVVKFLTCMSNSPTNNMGRFPQVSEWRELEEIDWPQFLKEGIPRWEPQSESDSSEWSETSEQSSRAVTESASSRRVVAFEQEEPVLDLNVLRDYEERRLTLMKEVQNTWYNKDHVRQLPASNWDDANIAILWENYLEEQVYGLIPIPKPSIISEYKVIREILWQLWEPHVSFCFKFSGDELVIAPDVTIGSVRSDALRTFLAGQFLPHINLLNRLRTFLDSLNVVRATVCTTRRCYAESMRQILAPIYSSLVDIEETVRKQDVTVTLLTLADDLQELLRPVRALADVHDAVYVDSGGGDSPLVCASGLLVNLHHGLTHACTKLEQDLYLTLYLDSLYKYLMIVDGWLTKDVFPDAFGEFVVMDLNSKDVYKLQDSQVFPNVQNTSVNSSTTCHQDWQMEFAARVLPEHVRRDPLIKILCTQVLTAGRNVHMLRMLGRLHLISDFGVSGVSFYHEFVERVLREVARYFSFTEDAERSEKTDEEVEQLPVQFRIPGMEAVTSAELNNIENMLDVNDGFLMKLYEDYFVVPAKQATEENVPRELTLYEKISKMTTSLFPSVDLVEKVFLGIFEERFSQAGQTVKNLMVTEIKLSRYLEFLQHTFLFKEDLIFPFYQRLFLQLDTGRVWGNHIWLTSHLQDLLMDVYPDLYEKCTVQVRDGWKDCADPLKACGMMGPVYDVRWPVNTIIRNEHLDMYADLFKFILKIKWALYTLNRVFFCELNKKKTTKAVGIVIMKLRILRFGLLNTFSNIQHYVFGYVISTRLERFGVDFERASDIDSLMKAHDGFIGAVHGGCNEFSAYRATTHGFYMLLYLVRKLRLIWRKEKIVYEEEVDEMMASYRHCVRNIDEFIALATYATF